MTTKPRIAVIFPGQGAQRPGMGKDFSKNYSLARETFEEADDILGRRLSTLMFDGSDTELTETRNSQTALFVQGIAIWRVLSELFPHLTPYVAGGLSLGEYTALAAEGRLDFTDGVPLVQKRGDFMNTACEESQGTMAVIAGLDASAVDSLVADLKMPNEIWVANYNCPGQVVISGTLKGVQAAAESAKERGARRVIPLQVHGAFHSGLMSSARDRLTEELKPLTLKESSVLHAMNVTGGLETDAETIKKNLGLQVTSSVRWEQDIRSMEKEGVDLYLEIGGTGKTLAGMNRRIGVIAPTVTIETIDDIAKLDEALANKEALQCKP